MTTSSTFIFELWKSQKEKREKAWKNTWRQKSWKIPQLGKESPVSMLSHVGLNQRGTLQDTLQSKLQNLKIKNIENSKREGKNNMQSEVKWSESCSVVSNSLWPHGLYRILQARILGWVVFPFSRGSSHPRDQIQVYHIAGRSFSWATREAQEYWRG